jgi:hypothetical protein
MRAPSIPLRPPATTTTGTGAPTIVSSHPLADKIAKTRTSPQVRALPAARHQRCIGHFETGDQFIWAVNVSDQPGSCFMKPAMTTEAAKVVDLHEIISADGQWRLELGRPSSAAGPTLFCRRKATDKTSVMLQRPPHPRRARRRARRRPLMREFRVTFRSVIPIALLHPPPCACRAGGGRERSARAAVCARRRHHRRWPGSRWAPAFATSARGSTTRGLSLRVPAGRVLIGYTKSPFGSQLDVPSADVGYGLSPRVQVGLVPYTAPATAALPRRARGHVCECQGQRRRCHEERAGSDWQSCRWSRSSADRRTAPAVGLGPACERRDHTARFASTVPADTFHAAPSSGAVPSSGCRLAATP